VTIIGTTLRRLIAVTGATGLRLLTNKLRALVGPPGRARKTIQPPKCASQPVRQTSLAPARPLHLGHAPSDADTNVGIAAMRSLDTTA
jgi:hypothetical protein